MRDAAREVLKNNRRPARSGHREWELSGGILRCAECGRAMTARTCPKPESGRTYLYYACVAGAYQRRDTCSARTHHTAELVEARIWDVVSRMLKDPERLRAGLDHMIEQERRGASRTYDPAMDDGEMVRSDLRSGSQARPLSGYGRRRVDRLR